MFVMNFIHELTNHLTGGNSLAFSIAAFFFVLLGALINVLYDVQTRNTSGYNTPVCWDWRYFWLNNRWRFGLNLLMALAVIRFFTEWTNKPLSMGYCFLIGIVFDAMFVVYRKLRRRIINILDNLS
jgi:hypothetical protein